MARKPRIHYTETDKAWIHGDESKSGKSFSVPLNEDALSVLRSRRGEHPVYVTTFRGRPVARTSTRAWYKALARAGIENFRWHDLRHTWSSSTRSFILPLSRCSPKLGISILMAMV